MSNQIGEWLLSHNHKERTEQNYSVLSKHAYPIVNFHEKKLKTNLRYLNRGRQKLEERLYQEAKKNSTDVIHPV
jgi:hypothetical protein